jgi:DNA anti-recombination protein RmuC
MDIEKTIEFLLEQQAKFDASLAASKAKFDAEMEELRKSQQATERLINAFAKAGAAQIELHQARLDGLDKRLETQEREFKAFLDRFDAFLKGRSGNGHGT